MSYKNFIISFNGEIYNYKEIYKDFVSQTTLDISSLIKKWNKSGVLENLLNFLL